MIKQDLGSKLLVPYARSEPEGPRRKYVLILLAWGAKRLRAGAQARPNFLESPATTKATTAAQRLRVAGNQTTTAILRAVYRGGLVANSEQRSKLPSTISLAATADASKKQPTTPRVTTETTTITDSPELFGGLSVIVVVVSEAR